MLAQQNPPHRGTHCGAFSYLKRAPGFEPQAREPAQLLKAIGTCWTGVHCWIPTVAVPLGPSARGATAPPPASLS